MRLMLTLTPVVCVLAAIAFSKVFEIYLKDDNPKPSGKNLEDTQNNRGDKNLYDKVGKSAFHKKKNQKQAFGKVIADNRYD